MTATIKISNLGKENRVWNHPRDMLLEVLSIGKGHRVVRALHEISFKVRADQSSES